MESERWDSHILNASRLMQLGQNQPEPGSVTRLYSRLASGEKEFFKTLVRKASIMQLL